MNSEKQSPARAEQVKREADVYDLLAWLEVNKKKVGIAAVVLVALGFALAAMRHFARQKEENAAAQLLALQPMLSQPTNLAPPQASALLKVANEFKGTTAAERAQILAATTLFTEGRYADAEKEFSRFLQEHPNSPWTASAAYGVAASQEANNKTNEAFASYQNVITAHANSPVVREAKLALARLYEARKQLEQALRLYNELTAPMPGAQMGEGSDPEAASRKEALLRQNPMLNTNRPVSAPVALPATTPVPDAADPNAATPAKAAEPAPANAAPPADAPKSNE